MPHITDEFITIGLLTHSQQDAAFARNTALLESLQELLLGEPAPLVGDLIRHEDGSLERIGYFLYTEGEVQIFQVVPELCSGSFALFSYAGHKGALVQYSGGFNSASRRHGRLTRSAETLEVDVWIAESGHLRPNCTIDARVQQRIWNYAPQQP